MSTDLVIVENWPKPKGYANGRLGSGRVLHIAGQIGWNREGKLDAKDLVGQFAQALDNVLCVVAAAHGRPEDLAEMTIYVTDIAAYRGAQAQLGAVWRQRLGSHFPAMALVGVSALVEPEAVIEIQAVAYVGDT
jgi:enamine deaminase RidA (YjgF/YER057c/UK114 family)